MLFLSVNTSQTYREFKASFTPGAVCVQSGFCVAVAWTATHVAIHAACVLVAVNNLAC